ncbi:hypothetical protein FJT64_022418 [Amphibalanus amphitrite]|uniref:Uncharacterized protein n=1 Tax=Amphibalanus amphitrite TaxID=1232801 RepID=A0A6A4WF63_AMPAM|nr:hypothetical protein FJT64_022418 [Amphibalanus amphitrite]
MPPSRCRPRSALLLLVTFTLTGPISAGAPYDPCALAPSEFCISNRGCCPPTVCVRVPASRKTSRGNCCYPTKCPMKCRRGERCQKILRRCARPPADASPCYCPPLLRCVNKVLKCDPPCGQGLRCGLSSGAPEPNGSRKHVCVRDKCSRTRRCPPGFRCQTDARGNCCRQYTCSRKCADNEVCRQVPPTAGQCPRPVLYSPPCFCQWRYACQSRCQPPCGPNERCAPAGGLEGRDRYTCQKKPVDECRTDRDCAAGSSCRRDSRGNCCYPTGCPNKCPVGERCQVQFPSCPPPPEPAPPCYCKPFYSCTSCTGPRCPIG